MKIDKPNITDFTEANHTHGSVDQGGSLAMGLFEVDLAGDSQPIDGRLTYQFEYDGSGDIEPLATIGDVADAFYELDANGDIQPKA